MKTLKLRRSFADQLQKLQGRGLQVDHPTAAVDYLERLNYCRLSGYRYLVRSIDPAAPMAQAKAVRQESFVLGRRFEDVARFYVFDKKLRLLALDALERIEMAVRVNVVHWLLRVICPNSSWGQCVKNLLAAGFPVAAHQTISLAELGGVCRLGAVGTLATAVMAHRSTQTKTDAYTESRGVGHIACNGRQTACRSHARGVATWTGVQGKTHAE